MAAQTPGGQGVTTGGRPHAGRPSLGRAVSQPVSWALARAGSAVPPSLVDAYDTRLLRHRMRTSLGYDPDLANPRTYNEKIAWRILHDRNPLFPVTTDKVAVRDYVARKAGAEVLVPLLGVYERASDVPWGALPRRFALKASHGCDMNLLVHDKDAADRGAVLRQAGRWLRRNYYDDSRQWAYRHIVPRLLAEELLLDEHGAVPADLKFVVFHGKTAMLRIHFNRFGEHLVNYYDGDLRPLAVTQMKPPDPRYQLMPEARAIATVAERLAEDFDHARVDLYYVRGQIRFGEITHYDGAAQAPFTPRSYDEILGDMWRLPYQEPG